MDAVIVEIRAAEGGEDAKLLVREQFVIYSKYAVREGFGLELLEFRPGFLVCRVSGKGVYDAFRYESGGHRVQRVPPTEKRGRTHTSTVTVAVLPEPTEVQVRIEPRDLDVQTCRASGSGGQKVNKTETAVQMTHRPSGITVRVETERSQHQNRSTALSLLRARLWESQQKQSEAQRAADRKTQVGSGQRADKIRTYRYQDSIVTDHRSGKKASLDRILRGFLDDLR